VRLLDLVEQDHGVRPAAHGLGQAAALVVADVAGGRADQARDGVLLLVLAHVDAHHVLLVVEQELGDRARDLGLADARRTEHQERAQGTRRLLQAGARAADGLGDGGDRALLADDALADALLHVQELLALGLEQLGRRDAGPPRDDPRDRLGVDGLGQHRALGLHFLEAGARLFEALLGRGQLAVADRADALEVALALLLLGLGAQLLDQHLAGADRGDQLLLGRPARAQGARLLAELGADLLDAPVGVGARVLL